MGFGMCFVAIPASGMVPRYFNRNRGLATGISVGGSSLGGVLWPIAFDQMLHHDGISFPWSMRIAGFIMIPLCVFCCIFVRPPVTAPKAVDQTSVEKGEQQPATGPEPKKKHLSVLRKPPFILLCCGLVSIFYLIYV